MKKTFVLPPVLVTMLLLSDLYSGAQMITGVWHGKSINKKLRLRSFKAAISLPHFLLL
ncbi:MAG: hypothetical protein WDO19_12115 [Bacteroidota bacterium]